MSETPDPVAALHAKDLPTRAAGARDLAQGGGPEHLGLLLGLALKDPSPGVRLGCAAAAADILSRFRLPGNFAAIPDADREAHWRAVKGVDPGVNAGIFQVCGTLGVPDAQARVLGALRDPRADVRQGACVGLWRMCASAAVNGDTALEARTVAQLDDARIRPETIAEIARVASVVGYASALEPVRRLAETATRNVATVLADALQRLEMPPGMAGIWADLGLDAGEVNPTPRPGALVALTGSDTQVRAVDGAVQRGPVEGPVRQLWLKRPGATEPGWALQVGLSTLHAADADEIGTFGDTILEAEAFDVFALVEPLLPVTAAAARLRGVARLRAGDLPGALEYLSGAVEMKKVPVDTWWFLADTLRRVGREAEAVPHLERFVAKGPKRSPFMAEAKRILGVE